MKTRMIMIVIAAVIAMQTAAAAGPAKKFATEEGKMVYAKKNLAAAFHSNNQGVIEDAARLTAVLKMRHPETDITELRTLMENISAAHPSGCVRYKMYVALHICSDPEWYAGEQRVAGADQETFYRAAAARMQEKLLSDNTQ